MLFNDQFVDSLKENPTKKCFELCEQAIEKLKLETSSEWTREDYEILLEVYALLTEIIKSEMIDVDAEFPVVKGSGGRDECVSLLNFVQDIKRQLAVQNSRMNFDLMRERFRLSLGKNFHYEFSQGDVEKMQDLLNQLRSLVAASDKFEPEHQQRLLRRLERLQSEIHKKVSDLDKFWGLIGDAGIAIGKFGKEAKPIVDRIKEITQIIWQAQSRAEELPSGTDFPQLGGGKKSSSEDEA